MAGKNTEQTAVEQLSRFQLFDQERQAAALSAANAAAAKKGREPKTHVGNQTNVFPKARKTNPAGRTGSGHCHPL
jgi:hypothetical protein